MGRPGADIMGRPEAANVDDQLPPRHHHDEHHANQAPAFHPTSKLKQPQPQQPEMLPPPHSNDPSNTGRPIHEALDDQPHEHLHPVQLPPPNPSQNMGSCRDHQADHHRCEYQANQAMNQTVHHQQARPLHVVQLPPPNYHSTNLLLHQYTWPQNYNGPAAAAHPPPTPSSTYYPPPPPPHHHRAASAGGGGLFYSTPPLFPPPAAYQFVPHQPLHLQYYNPAAVARNQLPPALHYNGNYFAETGIPLQNIQYLPMLLPQAAGIDNTWKTGLFECLVNPRNAITTIICPCWTFGQVAELVDSGQTSCAANALIYMLISLCIFVPCVLSCVYRKKLRNKFDLPESPAPDCIIHFLCECCALCQEHRELELRGLDPSLGWVGNMDQIQRLHQKRQVATVPPMTQRMMNH